MVSPALSGSPVVPPLLAVPLRGARLTNGWLKLPSATAALAELPDKPALADHLPPIAETPQQWWQAADTQQALQAVRATDWVDYSAVMALKLKGLRLAYPQFMARKADDAQRQALARFVKQGGESLWLQAAYDALYVHLEKETG